MQASASSSAKSSHVVYQAEVTEADGSTHAVGTHPMTANVLARHLLLSGGVVGPVSKLEREVTHGASRFDFVATHEDGTVTVVEVKNVPLADFADGDKKERRATKERQAADGPVDCYAKMVRSFQDSCSHHVGVNEALGASW